MRRLLTVLMLGGIILGGSNLSANPIPEHDPHTLIVKFADHIDGKALAQSITQTQLPRISPLQSLMVAGVANVRPLFPIPPRGLKNQALYDSLEMGQFFVADLVDTLIAIGVIDVLNGMPEIDLAEFNFICHLAGERVVPNDSLYAFQWHYEKIDLPRAWEMTTGSSGVLVGVIDTGIDYLHPDVAARIAYKTIEYDGLPGWDDDGNGFVDDFFGWDFVNIDNNPLDDQGHGTHVAGTIGAASDNSIGVCGIDWGCLLLPIKVANAIGQTLSDMVASGTVFAVNEGCNIANLSLVVPYSTNLDVAMTYAYNSGVAIIAGMGNNNIGSYNYPARFLTTLAVGATDSLDNRWVDNDTSGSDYGDHLLVVAPGDSIYSTYPTWHQDGLYGNMTGTSMATPHVSGLAALILSVRPTLSVDSLYYYILAGAEDQVGDPAEDTPGWDQYYGWGRINAYNSLMLAMGQDPNGILENSENTMPSEFSLHQNYPNPFNTSTIIKYETHTAGPVTLDIYNILGQRIFKQQLDVQTAGSHTFRWDGLNQTGTEVPSGIYFYRVSTDAITQSRKMVLLK